MSNEEDFSKSFPKTQGSGDLYNLLTKKPDSLWPDWPPEPEGVFFNFSDKSCWFLDEECTIPTDDYTQVAFVKPSWGTCKPIALGKHEKHYDPETGKMRVIAKAASDVVINTMKAVNKEMK